MNSERPPNAGSARSDERPAKAGRFRVRARPRIALAAVAGLAGLVVGAVLLVGERARQYPTPAFVANALGQPRPNASLNHTPAPGLAVQIKHDGFSYTDTAGVKLGLSEIGTHPRAATRYARGTLAKTSFGSQAITVGDSQAAVEDYLTVNRKLGPHTWQWLLDTPLQARVSVHGWVGFFNRKSNRLEPVGIAPVKILNALGKNVTPRGSQWGIETKGGNQYLTLALDDAKLPLPYTIDPGAYRTNAIASVAGAVRLRSR